MVHTQDCNVFVFDSNNQDHMQVYVMISHLSLILLFCNIICRVVLITYTTTNILHDSLHYFLLSTNHSTLIWLLTIINEKSNYIKERILNLKFWYWQYDVIFSFWPFQYKISLRIINTRTHKRTLQIKFI